MLFHVLMFQSAHAESALVSDTETATAGNFRLSWELASSGPYQLQQSERVNFSNPVLAYEGHDKSTVMSGLPNGYYYFRVRVIDGPWSEMVRVHVRHHALSDALLFFCLGAIMFGILVFVIFVGWSKQGKP